MRKKLQTLHTPSPQSWLEIAKSLTELGLSVLPVLNKKPKLNPNGFPQGRWGPLKDRLMTDEELRLNFKDFKGSIDGIAIICGQISGNLEVIDFDNKDELCDSRFEPWSAVIRAERPDLYSSLVISGSLSGGYHVYYRCTDPVDSSAKLARDIVEGGRVALIETRGEGSYAVIAPTPGYELIQGSLTNLPTISAENRNFLMMTARQFNHIKDRSIKPMGEPKSILRTVRTDLQAGHRYNQINDYHDLLIKHGWTLEKRLATEERWRRPGSDSHSSATFHTDTRLFYVFSTNADPLEDGGCYDPFGLLLRLEFDGDKQAAARYLYQQHPEWSIPSKGYKPSQQEQTANDGQLERLAGLHSGRPEDVEIPAGRQETGSADVRPESATTSDSTDLIQQLLQSMSDTDKSTIELMRWTPGTGKTFAAEAAAVKLAEQGLSTIFAMQSNERAEQEAAAMLERFGFQAAVIKGRNTDNCAQFESAEALGQGGHSVRQKLCRACPYRQDCTEGGYLSQFDGYQSGRTKVAFMPYESAVELLKDYKGTARLSTDVLVFDENPDRIAMRTHSLTVKKLDNIEPSTDRVRAVVDLLLDLILSGQRYGVALNDWSRLKKRIQSILKRFRYGEVWQAELGMEPERVMREAIDDINASSIRLINTRPESVARTEPRWLADIISELIVILTAETPTNTPLVVKEERIIFRKPRLINPKVKMIVLDAYGRPELYRQVFNTKVRVHQHQVKPNWAVYYAKMNTSKTRLKDERPGRWTASKWRQVIESQTSLFKFERMVIFTDKMLVDKVESVVESIGLSQKVAVDYFYRGRGTNKYQDFDAALIIGQAEPRNDVLVSECRALYRDSGYISDRVREDNRRQFKDPRLQQYKESKQIDEIVQCAYRIRPATASHLLGKKVIICTGFEVQGLTDQPEVIRLGGDKRCYTKSVRAEVRRLELADRIGNHLSEFGYLTLASGLNSTLAEIGGRSQSGRGFATFAINIRESGNLISECCKPSDSKDSGPSLRTIKNDLLSLVESGRIESHQVAVELDGKWYSPVVVYGSLSAFNTDIAQARAVLAEERDQKEELLPVEPTEQEIEPLPFDQALADKLKQYCISPDQWGRMVLAEGGVEISAAVRFAHLIGRVDEEARAAVLKIQGPEISGIIPVLNRVLDDRSSGLKILDRWAI